ncbi:MAG: hypothetical protein H6703_17230 [Myxococcales bacterium]|nr:hypothetical protein [Myxococcales bacterium]
MSRVRRLLGLARRRRPVELPADDEPRPIEGENLLIISDLHLGEACKEHSRIEYLKRAGELDAHICGFLDHFARHRAGDRPWRLLLGGDLLDFLQVTMTPPGTEGETALYGLGTREDESVWKLRRLMERHRDFFVFLADFVGAGHRLEIVQGNHDEELFWPAVRDTLVQGLVDLYFGDERHAQTPEAFAARIHFNPWFYYQPGLIYFEHGHRFDDYCATPPQLCPLKPQAEDELTHPLSYLAIRYFANRQPGFQTHDKEHWGVREYYGYFRTLGLTRALRSLTLYRDLLARVLAYHLEHGRFQSEEAHAAHRRRLAELAGRDGLDAATLDRLEALGAQSIMGRPLGLFTMMGMGEWSTALAILIALTIALLTDWPYRLDLALPLAVAAIGVVAVRALRRRYPRDIKAKLDRAAGAIGALLGVPVVAMGHSHRPVRRRMAHDHRAFYLNTGSFLAHDHAAHAPDEPCVCPTTFVVIEHPGPYRRPIPVLQRWCTVAERAEPFTPR